MTALINVSNRLPVTISKKIKPSSGGLVSALKEYHRHAGFKWVGWSGGPVLDEHRRRQVAEELEGRFNYYPIYISREDVQAYYAGFANASLWPLLHYFPTYAQFDQVWASTYHKINRLFAQTVADLAPADAMVWVHDYHLMLVPGLLREQRPDLRIGFFLHTPFPSYEIFRCLPNRRELLEGMLGANLIGFHTSGYVRHFRSTLLRLLGIDSDINTIKLNSHHVTIGVYPISIPVDRFLQEMQSETYAGHLAEYRRIYAHKKVVLNVERLDYTKGVPRRLAAIELFLERTGRKDVVFIFINVPSRESLAAYRELRRRIEHKVSEINGKYADIHNIPVHFIHQSVDFSELCALYTLADVAMVTPLIDGMNLVAKEYLVCKPDGDGVLILSEFAGAAQELYQASIVNPYDTSQMADALESAIDRPLQAKQIRLDPMRQRVMRYNAQRWADNFISDLATVKKPSLQEVKTSFVEPDMITRLNTDGRWAFFLDYDGALSDLRDNPLDAEPDQTLHELFTRMSHAPGLNVFLLSGRMRSEMEQWFGQYGFHLVAEHGYYYHPRDSLQWVPYDTPVDLQWKDEVREILIHYEDMTPGTFVEVKSTSLIWHYGNADPEFAEWKANQLIVELQEMLSNLPVEIHHTQKKVEVTSIFINKTIIVEHLKRINHLDRILYAGGSDMDEEIFMNAADHDLCIRVGKGTTRADFWLPDPSALRQFLTAFLSHRYHL